MKRLALLTGAAIFAISGALVAQEPNTSAPGPTTNPQPNTANNDLANPGNPQNRAPGAQPGVTVTDPHPGNTAQGATGTQGSTYAQSTGTTGTGTQGNGVTGGTTDTQTTGTGNDTTGMAGTSARTQTTGTTTGTTTTDTTGTTGTTSGSSMDSSTGGTTGHSMSHSRRHRRHHLPRTGSDMPLVGFGGLLALASGLALRRRA